MTEANLMRAILLACSRGTTRLFRQNVGQGWTGNATHIARPTVVTLLPGDVVIRNARPLHAGLCTGSSDLIGWTQRDGAALFTAVEVKTSTGRATAEQQSFIAAVQAAGGIAGVARSVDEARALIGD